MDFNGIDKCWYASSINYTKSDQKNKRMEKIEKIVNDCKRVGIQVKLPRINKCQLATSPDLNKRIIYLSPDIVKGLGTALNPILMKRNDFSSIEDFVDWASQQYSFTHNDMGEVNKTKIFSKAKYLILIKIGFFDEINNDMQQVWDIINDYQICSFDFREKKFIKTRQKWEYRCKNNAKLKEYIVEDYEKTCKVRIEQPLIEGNLDKLDGDRYKYQLELLEFMLDNPLDKYDRDYDLSGERGLFVISTTRQFDKEWGKSTLVTGFWDKKNISLPTSFFISGKNYNYPKGTILKINYKISKKSGKLYVKDETHREIGKI